MKQFKNILCVIEPNDAKSQVLERAVAMAENNQAQLTIAMVTAEGKVSTTLFSNVTAPLSEHLAQELAELVEPFQKRSDIKIETKLLQGTTFLAIIREVQRQDHDLVIKVAEPHEWQQIFFGSDDMHLLRKCPCPVWLTKAKIPQPIRSIVAAVDANDDYPEEELATRRELNHTIIQLAGSIAVAELADLHIAYAWRFLGESSSRHGTFTQQRVNQLERNIGEAQHRHQRLLDDLVQTANNSLGKEAIDFVKPELHLLRGPAHKEIPNLVTDLQPDLLVMGTIGRTGVAGFIIGNTAETILNHIDCSVLAIKPPGFESPVKVLN